MSTKRERLDSLTAKIQGNIDVGARCSSSLLETPYPMDTLVSMRGSRHDVRS